jgi:FKBP-type peptidyl-prolyl cis-trans isomerase (trigger factor)
VKILDIQTEKSVMTVTILIEPSEFALALEKAYQDNTEKFRIPDWHDGTAPRQELERVYGPTVLYDEALDRTIPVLYAKFVSSNNITQVDQPEIVGVSWPEDGGAAFTIRVTIYPTVRLGQYKGLTVQAQSNDESYINAVLNEAVRRMETDLPEGMIKQKLDAMITQEKMRVSQDAIYNVLADFVETLGKAYRAMGVTRPKAQVRHEAMDIMLQTMSADQGEPSKEHYFYLLTESVRRYRDLPTDFSETLERIIQEREKEKNKMEPEERINEVFAAYLGSLNITEEEWRARHRAMAAGLVTLDLLLDAVAEAEKIEVTAEETEEAYLRIAEQYGMDVTRIKTAVNAGSVEWQLRRDKARQIIVESAIHTEAPS